jgi:hypothetical protein
VKNFFASVLIKIFSRMTLFLDFAIFIFGFEYSVISVLVDKRKEDGKTQTKCML